MEADATEEIEEIDAARRKRRAASI